MNKCDAIKAVKSCVNNENNRYLLILVLAIAAALILPKITQDAFLRERIATTTDAVDMLAAAVEAAPSRPWYDHELNIRDGVEHLDQVEQVYAAAFKVIDGKKVQFTERFYETSPFEPFDFPIFVGAVDESTSGHVVIKYAPDNQGTRDLHLYFRWMPLYSGAGEQYLVVVGVSKHSIVSNAYKWLSVGLWLLVAAVAVPTVVCVLRVAECGNERDGSNNPDRGRFRFLTSKKYG